ncbi:MAG: hypothetical protein D6737_08095 [Chloroflexi bacterium]|nr:MAG: hypothetical protein D6737_08095 [Chloroflexota bacterium]
MSTQTSVIPNLVVSQRVIDKMANAARRYMLDETGEAMVGLRVPGTNTNGIPTLYVLDTISPDESAIRQAHTFQQGDDRQDEIIWWLQSNWEIYRQLRRDSYGSAMQAKWDVPLRYLGDWHKQPGYMIAPSGGDLMTALDWIDDETHDMEFLLAPIVTLGHPATTMQPMSNTNFVTVPHTDGTNTRIDFWYIDSDRRHFVPVVPTIYPTDQLPGLPEYPWHLAQVDRFEAEYGRLENDGLLLSLVLYNAIEKPPLEVCLMVLRMNAPKALLIITPWNYPEKAPSARVAPVLAFDADSNMYDVFEALWEQSEAVEDPPGWSWSPEKYLIDYVHALEDHLGIRPPSVDSETAAAPADDASDDAIDDTLKEDEKMFEDKDPKDKEHHEDDEENAEQLASHMKNISDVTTEILQQSDVDKALEAYRQVHEVPTLATSDEEDDEESTS